MSWAAATAAGAAGDAVTLRAEDAVVTRRLREAWLAEEGMARSEDELTIRLQAAATQAVYFGETLQPVSMQMLLNP
jgi:hypothetical protein